MEKERAIRVLVMSDTHRDTTVCNRVIERELPFDYLLHCGDAQMDPEVILEHREQYGLLAVRGNCDWFVDLPESLVRRIGGHKVLMVHGHRQDVRSGHDFLLRSARINGADIVLYGHTHVPVVRRYEEEGILVVNPGSLTENRPAGRPGSYAILTIPEDGAEPPRAEIFYLDERTP